MKTIFLRPNVLSLLGALTLLCTLSDVQAMPGSWKQVGQSGAWHRTTAATGLQGKLYTTESNGGLYATDVTTGHWKQIGKQDFVNTHCSSALAACCTVSSGLELSCESTQAMAVGKPSAEQCISKYDRSHDP